MKFRIIEEFYINEGQPYTSGAIIEQKTFFGWRKMKVKELFSNVVKHESYLEAEAYMYKNYMRFGDCVKNGNIYTFTYRYKW